MTTWFANDTLNKHILHKLEIIDSAWIDNFAESTDRQWVLKWRNCCNSNLGESIERKSVRMTIRSLRLLKNINRETINYLSSSLDTAEHRLRHVKMEQNYVLQTRLEK
jgi:hypothetical protein